MKHDMGNVLMQPAAKPYGKKAIGFDTAKYLRLQADAIHERCGRFDNKLYLEFGGKLCCDNHATRVLPGYQPDAKVRMFRQLKKDLAIAYCIGAKDIEKGKMRYDFGLTYDQQALKDIGDMKGLGIPVDAVVVTRFEGEGRAKKFVRLMENLGMKVYVHTEISGYPNDLDVICSAKGYGAQPYVALDKPLVVVTGPGPGSGKMAFCLAQIYHEHGRGVMSGFAKFETFPIWDLPLEHPVNIAYEAATAEMRDVNMIDPFHLNAYGRKAVNYNRDIENFGLLLRIMERIGWGGVFYKSPTDMGVNMAGSCIVDDRAVRDAARQEIVRRFFMYKRGAFLGMESPETVEWMRSIMDKAGVKEDDRKVVGPARLAAVQARRKGKGNEGVYCGAAVELPDGRIVTGKNSPLLHAESAAVLNAVKVMAGIPDNIHLLPPSVIRSINRLKTKTYGEKSESIMLDEALIALAISASGNPMAETCIGMLGRLRGCEMHTTHMPSAGDEGGLRKLGLNVTTDALASVLVNKNGS